MSTKERLAQVLHAAGLFDLEKRARAAEFDDFESERHDFPIIALVRELEAAGQPALAERARTGEFDSTKEEAEAWAKREGLA